MMSGAKLDRGLPVRRLGAARLVGLRQRERRNAEDGALDRAGDRAGIDHVLAGVAAAIDAGEDEIGRALLEDVASRP